MTKINTLFDLIEFKKAITSFDGKSESISSYGKILIVKRFDNNRKIIEKISYLEVTNVERYVSLKDYIMINSAIDNICQVRESSERSLPNELQLGISLFEKEHTN